MLRGKATHRWVGPMSVVVIKKLKTTEAWMNNRYLIVSLSLSLLTTEEMCAEMAREAGAMHLNRNTHCKHMSED